MDLARRGEALFGRAGRGDWKNCASGHTKNSKTVVRAAGNVQAQLLLELLKLRHLAGGGARVLQECYACACALTPRELILANRLTIFSGGGSSSSSPPKTSATEILVGPSFMVTGFVAGAGAGAGAEGLAGAGEASVAAAFAALREASKSPNSLAIIAFTASSSSLRRWSRE